MVRCGSCSALLRVSVTLQQQPDELRQLWIRQQRQQEILARMRQLFPGGIPPGGLAALGGGPGFGGFAPGAPRRPPPPAPQPTPPKPTSSYNIHMREEMARLKQSNNPQFTDHKQAWAAAAASWRCAEANPRRTAPTPAVEPAEDSQAAADPTDFTFPTFQQQDAPPEDV